MRCLCLQTPCGPALTKGLLQNVWPDADARQGLHPWLPRPAPPGLVREERVAAPEGRLSSARGAAPGSLWLGGSNE
jgi:hypothetical protein